MGANSKEIQLIDSIRSGDLQAAAKLLHKNVKHLTNGNSVGTSSSGTSRFLFKREAENGTLSRKTSSWFLIFFK